MSNEEAEAPDHWLVRQAAGGCADAFTTLFHRYYGRIRDFAFRLVLDGQAADDITQDTFIRAASQIGSLREGQAFAAWIYRIASNIGKDHLRRAASHQRKLHEMRRQAEIAGQVHDGDDSSIERVRRALARLPHRQREAVALVWFENCTHAEAAARVGCAEATISWRMALAKRTLRKHLSP